MAIHRKANVVLSSQAVFTGLTNEPATLSIAIVGNHIAAVGSRADMVRVVALKQFIDGVVSGYTAYMCEPYADRPDLCGETTFDPEVIKQWVVEADREDFSIRFHCVGDKAIRLAHTAANPPGRSNRWQNPAPRSPSAATFRLSG